MKKVTLSAALLALMMMGCSDAGLDNSVASTSTNEAQIENADPVLTKVVMPKIAVIEKPLSPGMAGIGDGYEYYAIPEANIAVMMQTRVDLDWDGYEGQGEYYVETAPSNPDKIIVVTYIVSDCEFGPQPYRNVRCGWKKSGVVEEVNKKGALAHTEGPKLSKYKDGSYVGAVSAFVGIWGQNASSKIVFSAATYNGELFKQNDGHEKAKAIYNTYVKPDIAQRVF